MKGMKVVMILSLAFVSLIACEDTPVTEEEGVLVLTKDNFEQVLQKHDHILVEFYAPWCGHCKSLAPEYAKAAQKLKADDLILAKVDATVEDSLASKYQVEGYPTLKLFTKGSPSDYNGGRTSDEIVNWMKKKTAPPSKQLNSADELQKFIEENKIAIVFFGTSTDASFGVYEAVAKSNDEFMFGHCGVQECQDTQDAKAGHVALFKKFDEGRNDYTEALDQKSLSAFIVENSKSITLEFDYNSAQMIFEKNTPAIFLYRDPNSLKAFEVEKIFSAACKQMKGKIPGVITGIKNGLEFKLAQFIGVTADELPSVQIHDTTVDLKKYYMEGDITEEKIIKFVDDWKNKKLMPYLLSEDIPEQKGDVYILVGRAFDQVVLDPTKDVLVEFYAPWCGTCQGLAPIYEELARKLKHNKNLIIAKMNATTNNSEHVYIQKYPTIKFWPAKKDKPQIDFTGNRTVAGFTEFLKKNAVNPITELDSEAKEEI